jgi:MFS family permease
VRGLKVIRLAIPSSSNRIRLGGLAFPSPAIRQSLLFSFWDGVFANAMLALNETFGTAAAVRLQAPTWTIPLITSLPVLLGAAGQFLLPLWSNPQAGRKRYVLLGVRLQAIGLFLCGYLGFLPGAVAAYSFVLIFALAGVSGNMTSAYWMAWMADMVPPSIRGRHFAWRNVFFAWTSLSCSLLAGMVAREFDSASAPWILFTVIFSISGLLRGISSWFMAQQYEPPTKPEKPAMALHTVHRLELPKGFAHYALTNALFLGAANIAGPFFAVWYLRDLHFNYLYLGISSACTVFGAAMGSRYWGSMADRKGQLFVLKRTSGMLPFIPLVYLFISHPGIIWIMNMYGGLCWAGYNLANFNLMLESSGQERKTQTIAYFSLISGISLTVFGVLSGFLSDSIPQFFDSRLQSMFLLSGVLRFGVWFFMVRRIHFAPGSHPQASD